MHDKSAWAQNLGTLHDDRVAVAPDEPALILYNDETTVTYEELAAAISRAGNALRDLGVEHTERVALCFENGLELVATYFGAIRAGFVPVPVNVKAASKTVRHVISDSGAQIIVASEKAHIRSVAADAIREDDGSSVLATYGNYDETDDIRVVDFEAYTSNASATLDPVDVAFNDPAIQPYSSGSTGNPKGIVLSHGGAYWNTKRFKQVNHMDEHDVTLVAAPLYHKNAMLNTKTTLLGGGTVVIMDGFNASAAIEAIDTHDVTYLTGVPAIYQYLVEDNAALTSHDVSSVEAGSTGSDAVPNWLYEKFKAEFGAPLTEGYGLTEGGPMITMTPRWGVKKRGSAGIPLPEVDTRIIDPETGEELPDGEPGELIVASPGVAHYYERPDLEAERFEERDDKRFLRTGDLVYRDDDRYHYIVGRLDDMLIVGGENVYPASVEQRLEEHDAVFDAVVVPVSHRVKGEVPVAFVIPNRDTSEEVLKQFTLENGPAYAHPRRVFFVEDYPLTGTEKVDRTELTEQAADRVGTLPSNPDDD
ncbi:class I adenylate-forming enzyme family protein [Natronorubrum halophilum]|uniref:class I adenylate-forming enzyme family protein n=1 Tax=Natronorubrum halophilum TaxID=1702106 RepID=UPI0010C1EDC0|nr:class I adenylate-forming enzyme family protein [Natronorubrum halophilum]